ncbi:hypothetical protein [Streptomyces indicus]|uniref:Uncharacterized protein n=1 Tax=Streptomyces indicus TaxID=417292 RepID=A0A1G9IT14_9ACTN|nr:hypothetical protein [Streptomyces indicus]SDL28448.1 hypothetical protein SAMN05421806_12558 [Streptomyces indicus]
MSTVTPMRLAITDQLDRALWRERTYNVPDAERRTCDEHSDWRDKCAHLHKEAA